MAGHVVASGFSGSSKALNGTSLINASHADLVRSLLTVGYPSSSVAVLKVGYWRARMLHAMANGFLDSGLRTTKYFTNLEQSEKVGVTFLMGGAFTHWYALDRMSVKHVIHVQSLNSFSFTKSTASFAPKPGSVVPAAGSRPDFIGLDGLRTHVFESKGRQRNPDNGAIAKALGQVSSIRLVNGRKPRTRCATFFMLKASGVTGRIVDPPASDVAVNIRFDVFEAMTRSYALFLDLQTSLVSREIEGLTYLGIELADDAFFGVDKEVLAPFLQPPATGRQRAERRQYVDAVLEEKGDAYLGLRTPSTSAGRDGTILLGGQARSTRVRVPTVKA